MAKPTKIIQAAKHSVERQEAADLLNENNNMNLTQIQDLIKFVSKSGVSEVAIEQKDFKITIKAQETRSKMQEIIHVAAPVSAPMAALVAATVSPAATSPAAEEPKGNTIEVKSPMIGTFYRSATPDKPAFVEVGSMVKQGDTVCVIEAMKLFNEIEAEISGRIVKVLVDDATPVEYDQPLFLVDPS